MDRALFFCRARIMDYQEKQRLIDLISWGKLPTVQQDIHFVLDTPTLEIKAMSTIVFNEGLAYAKSNGLLSEEECLNYGGWSEDDETDILTLRRDLDIVKKGLIHCIFNTMKLMKAKGILRNIEKQYRNKALVKQGLLFGSERSHALMQQQRYIISRITRLEDGELFWSTQESFDVFENIDLINGLCEFYFLDSFVSEAQIRLLARTEPWRSTWAYFKTGGDVFERDLSSNQQRLVFWSQAYDNVFDAYERPTKKIINDDDVLDSWFMQQAEKIEKGSTDREVDKLAPKKQPKGRQEIFIPTSKEAAREIFNLNSAQSKGTIKMRERVLKDGSKVEDQDLPDSQSAMRQQATQELSKRMKSISNRR